MDLVYLFKEDSNPEELKYSIRSVEKNLKFDKLFIIGKKPEILNEKAIEIYIPDTSKDKYQNVVKKILEILEIDEISDDFILMNDDFFVLKRYETFPYYYNKELKDWIGTKTSLVRQKLLKDVFKEFPDGKYYDVHCPIVYNKGKLIDLIYKYRLESFGLLRTYYGNEYELEAIETQDYKITNTKQIKEYEDKPFISTNDVIGVCSSFKAFINSKFPYPSKYEK